MAHTISDRRRRARGEEFRAAEIAVGKRELKREARHHQRIVDLWNRRAARGARQTFFPIIEVAISAGAPWLQVRCPGCQTIGEVDLRRLDRHGGMAISGLIPSLSCRMCSPNPPFAKLIGLTADPQTPTWRSSSWEAMQRARREHR